jgi:hypothetical protein
MFRALFSNARRLFPLFVVARGASAAPLSTTAVADDETAVQPAAASGSHDSSGMSIADRELLEDLEDVEMLDERGLARPDKICPCLKKEIQQCGDVFLLSFGCAILYRRDFQQSSSTLLPEA